MAKKKIENTELTGTDSAELLPSGLVDELRGLIQQTRAGVAHAVNSALVNLYWQTGTRIRTEVLKNERADYGKQICVALSHKLVAEFGSGFSRPNLFKMLQFSEVFPDSQIVLTLSRQLSWSHFTELIREKDSLKREFYAEMCRLENWSVRTLRSKINGMLFERTALSKKPAELARQELAKLQESDQLSPDLVFRDTIELLRLDESGIRVASYLTELPPIDVLRQKLHESVARAQLMLDNRKPETKQ